MFLTDYEVLANSVFEKDVIFGEFGKEKEDKIEREEENKRERNWRTTFTVFSASSSSWSWSKGTNFSLFFGNFILCFVADLAEY